MPPAPARPAALAPPPMPSAVRCERRCDHEQRAADERAAPGEMLRSAVVALDLDVAVEVLGDHGNSDVVELAARLRVHDSIEVADGAAAVAIGRDGQCDGGVVSHRSAPCSVRRSRSSSPRTLTGYPHSAGLEVRSAPPAESGYRLAARRWFGRRESTKRKGSNDDLGDPCISRSSALVVRGRALSLGAAQSGTSAPPRKREGTTSPAGQVSVDARSRRVGARRVRVPRQSCSVGGIADPCP